MKVAGEIEFWKKVSKSKGGCWLWNGAATRDGYGQVKRRTLARTKNIRAHHYAWFLAKGRLPPVDKCLCHRCDTPACVRVGHLFVGTRKDNSDDKVLKGRQSTVRFYGSTNPMSKLTELQVIRIRASTLPNVMLAGKYRVNPSCIYAIRTRSKWRHI